MKRTIRGIRDKIPGGYVIGRLPGRGSGPVTLIKFTPDATNAVGGSGGGSSVASMAIEFFAGGLMRPNEVVGQFISPSNITLPVGLTGSYAKSVVASTGAIVLTIRKATAAGGVGSSIGTITFTGSTTGVIVFTTETTFAAGDRLIIQCPSPANVTLSDTTVVIIASL